MLNVKELSKSTKVNEMFLEFYSDDDTVDVVTSKVKSFNCEIVTICEPGRGINGTDDYVIKGERRDLWSLYSQWYDASNDLDDQLWYFNEFTR